MYIHAFQPFKHKITLLSMPIDWHKKKSILIISKSLIYILKKNRRVNTRETNILKILTCFKLK